MSWHVRKNRSLHENVLALTLTTVPSPRVARRRALTGRCARAATSGGPRRVSASWSGRTSRRCCTIARSRASHLDLDDVTYYVGHETIVRARGRQRLAALASWRFSRRWAATRRGSATPCACLTIRWLRSAARSASEARGVQVGPPSHLRPRPAPGALTENARCACLSRRKSYKLGRKGRGGRRPAPFRSAARPILALE